MISKRAQAIDTSGIRRIFDLAANLKTPVNLSIGQPDFDALPEVKEGAIRAINNRKSSYTASPGIPELRAKIRQKYGIGQDNKELDVFVTLGVSAALFLSYMAMLDPGDEILIPDPYFGMYRDQASMLNATARCYDTYPNFQISLEKIEQAYTPKTKAILVNSPNNPTGYSMSQSELDGIIEFAREKDIWLIYDEIYELFSYDRPHARCFGKYEKALIVGGFSKSHGIPGWRMGFGVGPTRLIQEMLKLQQYSFVCAPSIAQWGMLEGIDADLSEIVCRYREKRDFIFDALRDKFEVERPNGAFYIFPKAPGGSGQAFVEECLKNNLLVVPGHVFSSRDSHFRISFAAPIEQLEKGAEILNRLA